MRPSESRSHLDALARSVPTDEESARRAVAATARLEPVERWRLFTELLREMDALSGSRPPLVGAEDLEFWRHWGDPMHGRTR
jgi:hypothetical protein